MVGRRISGKDFENLSGVRGLIIQRGVKAIIYTGGKPTAELTEGTYEFVKDYEIENLLEQKVSQGIAGRIRNAILALGKAITGRKVSDNIEKAERSAYSNIDTLDKAIDCLRRNADITVYLVVAAPFTVAWPVAVNPDGKPVLSSQQIRCRHLSTNVAMTLNMRITNSDDFIRSYLLYKSVATITDIANRLNPTLKYVLEETLRHVDINEYGISTEAKQIIYKEISNRIGVTHGISFEGISDFITENEDLERLRKIADELFLSEKELDMAVATAEFRNKLAAVENRKKIDEVKTDYDLYKALTELDKEKKLDEEELDKFYMLLSRQRRIREAANELEIEKALQELAGERLISADKAEELKTRMSLSQLDREALVQITGMEHLAEIELKRKEIEKKLNAKNIEANISNLHGEIEIDRIATGYGREKETEDARHRVNLVNLELEGRKAVDDYEMNRRRNVDEWELEKRRRENDLNAQEMERLNSNTKDMLAFFTEMDEKTADGEHHRKMDYDRQQKEHEREMTYQKYNHETELRAYDTRDLSIKAGMTPEQQMANNAANLDAEAQKAFAEALGSKKVIEVQEACNERIMGMAADSIRRQERTSDNQFDRMERMFNTLAGMQTNMQAERQQMTDSRYEEQRELKEEYRNQMYHAQERQDNMAIHTMEHESKLQNTTVDAIRATSMNSARQEQVKQEMIECPHCHRMTAPEKFCTKCHSELR